MRRRFLLLLWLLTDLALFVSAYVIAYFLRVGWILSSDFPLGPYMTAVLLSAPLWILMLLVTRTFGLTRSQRSPKTIAYICYACLMGAALFTLNYYFLNGVSFSRLLLVESLFLSTCLVLAWHMLFEKILRTSLRRDPPAFPTLIVGVTRESKRLIESLNQHQNPLKPVAILDGVGAKEKEIDGVPVLGKLNILEETLAKNRITHLIQCSDLEQSLNLLSACRARGITYMLLPSVLGIIERDERIESLEGQAVTVVSPGARWWAGLFG